MTTHNDSQPTIAQTLTASPARFIQVKLGRVAPLEVCPLCGQNKFLNVTVGYPTGDKFVCLSCKDKAIGDAREAFAVAEALRAEEEAREAEARRIREYREWESYVDGAVGRLRAARAKQQKALLTKAQKANKKTEADARREKRSAFKGGFAPKK